MNIPLNIDWRQILLHLFNFGILTGGLWLILYKPVKAFMDKREQAFKDREDEATRLRDEAAELHRSYEEKLTEAEAEAPKDETRNGENVKHYEEAVEEEAEADGPAADTE